MNKKILAGSLIAVAAVSSVAAPNSPVADLILNDCAVSAAAQTFSYTLLGDGTAEITSYNGSNTSLTIPSEIDGYKVTALADGAFANSGTVKKITVPDSVTTLSNRPFGFNSAGEKISELVVYCAKNSAAEIYCNENGFEVVYTDVSKPADVATLKTAAATQSTVKLSWSKVKGAEGYLVYRYSGTENKWVEIADVTAASYTDSNLTSGKSYSYAVKAYVSGGSATVLKSANYATLKSSTKPAVVKTVKATAVDSSTVKVTWSKVSGAQAYSVYRYNSETGKWGRLGAVSSCSYTDSGRKSGKTYKYAVRAYRTVADKKFAADFSSSASATTMLKDVAGLKAAAQTNSVKLSWGKVSGAQGYYVYKYNTASGKWAKTATTKSNSYSFSKLSAGKQYKYAVKAYKTVSGNTITSKSMTKISAVTKLKAVSKLKTSSSSDRVRLTWSKVSGAQGYHIYTYDNAQKKWVVIADTKSSVTTYTVKNLTPQKVYRYGVRAYTTVGGKETLSESLTARRLMTTPQALKFSIKTAPTQATVSWTKISGVTGYKVYFKTDKNADWTLLKTLDSSASSYTKTGLTKGKTYYFTVRSYTDYNGERYLSTVKTKSAVPYYTMSANPTAVEQKAAAVLDSIAQYNGVEVPTLYMAYCWSKMTYVKNLTNPNLGTAWFANCGLTNHYGNCYVMAATFTTFARLLGYNAVQISGSVPLVSGGTGPHSWVEVTTSNGTFVCDPDLEWEFGVNYYWIQYHPISAGSSYYIVGDGKHVKYNRIRTMY